MQQVFAMPGHAIVFLSKCFVYWKLWHRSKQGRLFTKIYCL